MEQCVQSQRDFHGTWLETCRHWSKAEKHLTICCISLHVQCVEQGEYNPPDSFKLPDTPSAVLKPGMPLEQFMVHGPHWGKFQSSFQSHINKCALKKGNGCCSYHTIITLFQQLQNVWTEIHNLLLQVFIISLKYAPLNAVSLWTASIMKLQGFVATL